MMSANDFHAKQILVVIPKDGQKLAFRNDNVVVLDADEKIIHQSTCFRLFAIYIISHMTITTALIQKAKKFGFAIVMMSTNFRLYQVISANGEGNTILRQNQYNYVGIEAAKKLISNKIRNQIALLSDIREKTNIHKDAIMKLNDFNNELPFAKTIYEIMGCEGNASKVYFKAFFDNVSWNGRQPRIKRDMVNATMDIGYTLLFSYIDALLAIYGFDRYVGILHRQFYMRKSLVCDLVEPFRILIDKQIKKSINLKQIKESDFDIKEGKWILKIEKSADYTQLLMNPIIDNKDEIFVYIRNVYRTFMKKSINDNYPCWEYEK